MNGNKKFSSINGRIRKTKSNVTNMQSEINVNSDVAEHLGSSNLQSLLVDGAIASVASLPNDVMQVMALYGHHNEQISVLKEELQELQEQTKQAHEASAELRDEAESIKRKICQLEEENSKICNQCMKVKNEILLLVVKNDRKRKKLQACEEDLQDTERKLKIYRQKLENYQTSTTCTDSLVKILSETKECEERLSLLQLKKEYMQKNAEETAHILSNGRKRELQKDIEELNLETESLSKEINILQGKTESTRKKQKEIEQATTVLQKRNAAQLIRMKRQVKEQQMRYSQWQEQLNSLQQSITTLTQKLNS